MMSFARSRGLRLSCLASGKAILQAKSPCDSCLVRESSMAGSVTSGSATPRASASSWLRWVLRSDMIWGLRESDIISPGVGLGTAHQPHCRQVRNDVVRGNPHVMRPKFAIGLGHQRDD